MTWDSINHKNYEIFSLLFVISIIRTMKQSCFFLTWIRVEYTWLMVFHAAFWGVCYPHIYNLYIYTYIQLSNKNHRSSKSVDRSNKLRVIFSTTFYLNGAFSFTPHSCCVRTYIYFRGRRKILNSLKPGFRRALFFKSFCFARRDERIIKN